MSEVIVLHASLDGSPAADPASDLLERLPYARRLELERRDAVARRASLRGLELLLDGVARLRGEPPPLAALRYPQGGKPSIDGGPCFSVTHSAVRVAVALSDACDVGIDVEELAAGESEGAARLARWTAVEATLKAAGAGLRRAGEVRLAPDLAGSWLDGREYGLQRVALATGCVAHLATAGRARLRVLPCSAA